MLAKRSFSSFWLEATVAVTYLRKSQSPAGIAVAGSMDGGGHPAKFWGRFREFSDASGPASGFRDAGR